MTPLSARDVRAARAKAAPKPAAVAAPAVLRRPRSKDKTRQARTFVGADPDQLTAVDVRELLAAYSRLVARNESLERQLRDRP